MNSQVLLGFCAALLLCILVVIVYQNNQKSQTLGSKIDEAVEEVKDEIDDHTTKR